MKNVFKALFVFLFVGSIQLQAAHISGGDITYVCNGGMNYDVTLQLYRDCSGFMMIDQDLNFVSDCGNQFTITNIAANSSSEVSQLCGAQLPNSTCSGGTLPGMEIYEFVVNVNLPPCDGWTISWDICCRNTSLNVALTPGIYIESTLNNATAPCNSSPVFTDQSIPYVCQGQPVSYAFSVAEPDGDSYTYSLIDARFAAPTPTAVTYIGPFSGANPYTGLVIDPNTGVVTFTPTNIGNIIVVVQVDEFDINGNLIGTVMRDMLFVVLPCTNQVPIASSVSNITGPVVQSSPNVLDMCVGESFCFDIVFNDLDATDVLSITSTVTTLLPGATLTIAGTNPAVATICWTAQAGFNTVTIPIMAEDPACPITGFVNTAVTLNIYNTISLPPVDAGLDGTVDICGNTLPFNLYNNLGGTPDPGGFWTDPSGNPHSGTFDQLNDGTGVYTYVVVGASPCDKDTALVTVNLGIDPDAGSNGNLSICSDGAITNLIASLGGSPDAGGSWTDPSSAAHSGMFDPSNDPAGNYTYTVAGTLPCADATATVSVTVQTAPDAGANALLTLCDDSPITDLFNSLGGTPDAGGSWTDPSAAAHSGMFDPSSDAAGIYTYTVNGVAPCGNAAATVTVSVNSAPDVGSNGTVSLCTNGPVTNLFTLLGGSPDAGGAWTDPNSAAHNGMFDPSSDPAGIYTYLVTGVAPCVDQNSTVTVTLVTEPDAGSNSVVNTCNSDPSFNLFNSLGGAPDAGGAWTDPSSNPHSGNFDPSTDPGGIYTYTVTGAVPCANATATVTVTLNVGPDAGADATITLCDSDAPFDPFTQLGGTPAVGGTWSDPSSDPFAGNIDPASDPAGNYTYTVPGVAPCTDASAVLTVNINAAPDAGTNALADLCSTDAPVGLFSLLGGTPGAGGTWTDPGSNPFGGTFDPSTSTAGIYTYTVPGLAPCVAANATVTVTVLQAPDAGSNSNISVCSDAAVVDLFTQIGGAPDAGGGWTDPSSNPHSGLFDPANDPAGNYTYTVAGAAPCTDALSTVNVSLITAPDAGTNANVSFCSSDAPLALFGALGGTPDAGGSWTDPNNSAWGGTLDPVVDIAGIYTYTVTGSAPCVDVSATITVTIETDPDAGANSIISLCETDAPLNLFTQLGGSPDAGGAWLDPSSNPFGGTIDPSADPSGVYTYTVNGVAPCGNASATVTVTINSAPDAGADNVIDVCDDAANVDLFTLLGGAPNAGGNWTDSNSAAHTGMFDPASDPAGNYVYTVAGTAPCVDATATITVNLIGAADAGNNNSLDLCEDDAVVDLFTQLGGTPDAGGSWTDPSSNAFTGMFDPASDAGGIYTYTVTGTAPCSDATATVTVNLQTAPDAGMNASTSVCESDTDFDLFTILGGSPDVGGTWTDPSSAPFVGNFDPAIHSAGIYTYTVMGTAPCADQSATVTVTVNPGPNAGIDATIDLCTTGAVVDLFTQLGGVPDAGGSWTDPSNNAFGGNFDPSTDPAGNYTYTVLGVAPCPQAAAVVTVNVVQPADPGTNGSTSVCESDTDFDLFTILGGSPDAGGTWTDPSSAPFVGNFDPAIHSAGIYTYTVPSTAPCADQSSTVTVTVNPGPNAGVDATIDLCTTGAVVDLFTQLGGVPDAGGSWTDPSNNAFGGNFDPSTDPVGNYTYTVLGVAPCPQATAVVTVNVNSPPDPGVNAVLGLCESDPVTDLFAQLGGAPDAGGTWTDPNSVAHSGNFDPSIDPIGVYTYTVNGTAPCADQSATVLVSTMVQPQAGLNNVLDACESDLSSALFGLLGGSPDAGGTWMDPNNVAHPGSFDPSVDPAGVYTYTVSGNGICSDASATITTTIQTAPDAGVDNSIIICQSDPVFDMFTLLGGSPDGGGSWTDPNGNAVGNMFTPGTDPDGIYSYTVSANPCPDDVATLTITYDPSVNAGLDTIFDICASGTAINMFDQLGGSPDPGGTWTDPNGIPVGAMFDPATGTAGNHTYTVAGNPPCPDASSILTINVIADPDAGTDASVSTCLGATNEDLFLALGGSPGAGGSWTDPNSAPSTGIFQPGIDVPGIYTYTVLGSAPCPNASATVTVSLNPGPDPGLSSSVDLCENDPVISLFDELGGAPDAGGAWTDPSNDPHSGNFDPATDPGGVYTYTVTGLPPCPAASSTINVNIELLPDPGLNGNLNLCENSAVTALFGSLGGSPDAGGSWVDPNNIAHSGNFDPTVDLPGIYTYTVTGSGVCAPVAANVSVAVNPIPDAGIDSNIVVCQGDPAFDLFAILGGTPALGGTWNDPNNAPIGNIFTPGISLEGIYTYTVAGIAPCPDDQATVDVSTIPGPFAGGSNAIALCNDAATFDMIDSLLGSPDTGGVWTDINGLPVASNFDPSTGQSGIFSYTVTGSASCPDAIATLDITVNPSVDAGLGNSIDVCDSDASFALFTQLGGTPDAGGTWTDPNGNVFAGSFNPAVDPGGNYTYSVTATAPCPSQTSILTINLHLAADAGTNGASTNCEGDPAFDLFDQLGGTPDLGGIWTDPNNQVCSSIFDPGTDPQGTYTYTVSGSGPCADDQSMVEVEVNPGVNAGQNGNLTVCANDANETLFSYLNGIPDVGGDWEGPGGVPHSGVFIPGTDPAGIYTYTVLGVQPCPSAVAEVLVNVLATPQVDFSADQADGCSPVEVTFTNSTNITGDCFWDFGNGITSTDCDPDTIQYDQPGSYDVALTVTLANGCSDNFTDFGMIGVFDEPTAAFHWAPNPTTTQNPNITFINTSLNGNAFSWDFGGLGTSSEVNPQFTFPNEDEGTYAVCLTVENGGDCFDQVCYDVFIELGLTVYVPNAFTPDGNGVNDGFYPVISGVDPEQYEFMIFDRWGHIVFETDEMYKGWDGSDRGSDTPVQDGVYAWKLTVKDVYSGNREQFQGHVTLLR